MLALSEGSPQDQEEHHAVEGRTRDRVEAILDRPSPCGDGREQVAERTSAPEPPARERGFDPAVPNSGYRGNQHGADCDDNREPLTYLERDVQGDE